MDRVGAIRERITRELNPVDLEVRDDSARHAGHAGAASGGGHFIVKVVSPRFEGKSLIERHRMIYTAVGDMMPAEIHALSITATAPGER